MLFYSLYCQSFSSRKGVVSVVTVPVWLPGPMFLSFQRSLSLVPCSFWEEVSVPGQMNPPDQRTPWTETSFLDRDPTGQSLAFCTKTPLDRDQLFGQRSPLPLYGKELVVRILLEYILVFLSILLDIFEIS